MNTLIEFSDEITKKRGLVLVVTKDKARASKTQLIANVILNGSLLLVSGDEWVPAFELSQIIRARTTEVQATTNRLRFTRAATCYRLLDALASIDLKGEPILVTDFFHSFYDADIPLHVRLLNLRECCRELKRLAFYRPVIVMLQESKNEDFQKFIPTLDSIADKSFTFEPELEPVIEQPVLF